MKKYLRTDQYYKRNDYHYRFPIIAFDEANIL